MNKLWVRFYPIGRFEVGQYQIFTDDVFSVRSIFSWTRKIQAGDFKGFLYLVDSIPMENVLSIYSLRRYLPPPLSKKKEIQKIKKSWIELIELRIQWTLAISATLILLVYVCFYAAWTRKKKGMVGDVELNLSVKPSSRKDNQSVN